MSQFTAQIDVRKYPPKEKHPAIFNTFDSLMPGQSMQLTNDHDPRPLFYQLSAERPEQFNWEYQAEGPEVWQVIITKK